MPLTAFQKLLKASARSGVPLRCFICCKEDVEDRLDKINGAHLTGHHVIPKYVRTRFPDIPHMYWMLLPVCRSCHDALETTIKTNLPGFDESVATFSDGVQGHEVLKSLCESVLKMYPRGLTSGQLKRLAKGAGWENWQAKLAEITPPDIAAAREYFENAPAVIQQVPWEKVKEIFAAGWAAHACIKSKSMRRYAHEQPLQNQ